MQYQKHTVIGRTFDNDYETALMFAQQKANETGKPVTITQTSYDIHKGTIHSNPAFVLQKVNPKTLNRK